MSAKLGKRRGRAMAFSVDVSDYAKVERARDKTLTAFGRIDIRVNNARIAGPTQTTWDYPLDAWREVMAVNLDGPFHSCRAVVPQMIANNYGRIVNIASSTRPRLVNRVTHCNLSTNIGRISCLLASKSADVV